MNKVCYSFLKPKLMSSYSLFCLKYQSTNTWEKDKQPLFTMRNCNKVIFWYFCLKSYMNDWLSKYYIFVSWLIDSSTNCFKSNEFKQAEMETGRLGTVERGIKKVQCNLGRQKAVKECKGGEQDKQEVWVRRDNHSYSRAMSWLSAEWKERNEGKPQRGVRGIVVSTVHSRVSGLTAALQSQCLSLISFFGKLCKAPQSS